MKILRNENFKKEIESLKNNQTAILEIKEFNQMIIYDKLITNIIINEENC